MLRSSRVPSAILLNKLSLKFFDRELWAPNEIHQSSFTRADVFDRFLEPGDRSLGNLHQTIFVSVQQIAGPDVQAQNLDGHPNFHDLEIGMTHHGAPGEVVKAKTSHFGNVAHPP